MKAIVQDVYGNADVLQLLDVPKPAPSADEVLIRVRAAGVDQGVWHLMTGMPYLVRLFGFGLKKPKVPIRGREVAGVVEAVGADVTRFQPGDEVYGTCDGSFAGQLAKAFGAEVTGVCSTSKVDLVRSLGADHVIDYTRDDFSDAGALYDVILDTAGNRPLSVLRKALAPRGTLVIVGGEAGGKVTGGFERSLGAPLASLFSRQKFKGLVSTENYADLEALTSFLEAGSVKPAIDNVYSLSEAPAAVSYMHAGQARGKVVVRI